MNFKVDEFISFLASLSLKLWILPGSWIENTNLQGTSFFGAIWTKEGHGWNVAGTIRFQQVTHASGVEWFSQTTPNDSADGCWYNQLIHSNLVSWVSDEWMVTSPCCQHEMRMVLKMQACAMIWQGQIQPQNSGNDWCQGSPWCTFNPTPGGTTSGKLKPRHRNSMRWKEISTTRMPWLPAYTCYAPSLVFAS